MGFLSIWRWRAENIVDGSTTRWMACRHLQLPNVSVSVTVCVWCVWCVCVCLLWGQLLKTNCWYVQKRCRKLVCLIRVSAVLTNGTHFVYIAMITGKQMAAKCQQKQTEALTGAQDSQLDTKWTPGTDIGHWTEKRVGGKEKKRGQVWGLRKRALEMAAWENKRNNWSW